MLYNAVYFAIFLAFVRKIVDKIKVPLEHTITSESRKHTDEWYVCVNGYPIDWSDDREEALAFCFACMARARSLSSKISIVENDEMPLVAVDTIQGLSEEEIDAVNATIDDFE